MKIVRKEIIKASPDAVFNAVTNFSGYEKWNPWVVKAQGECKVGGSVVVDGWVGGKLQQYDHKILQVERPHLFHWCDVGWFTLFADGERIRTFEEHPEGTLYTVILNVIGPLAFIAQWIFGRSLEEGMTKETHALKHFVESQC